MPVTQTGETLSPHYIAGLVAAARIDNTDDVDSYWALEAVSKTVFEAVSPRGLLLPVHDRKLTDTTTTVAVVYKGRQLLALSAPDPEGEHLFDAKLKQDGGSKRTLSRRRIDELSEGAERVRHLIAAHIKWVSVARLESAGL